MTTDQTSNQAGGDDSDDDEDGDEGTNTTANLITTGSTTGTGAAGSSNKETWDEDRARRTIAQQREAEKALRKQNTEYAQRIREFEDRDKTESEKTQQEIERLKQVESDYIRDKRDRNTREAFIAEAEKQGALKPLGLLKLAEGLDVDDEGKPSNATDVIKNLKTEYPELFQTGSANGNSGRGQQTQTRSMNDILRNQLRGRR